MGLLKSHVSCRWVGHEHEGSSRAPVRRPISLRCTVAPSQGHRGAFSLPFKMPDPVLRRSRTCSSTWTVGTPTPCWPRCPQGCLRSRWVGRAGARGVHAGYSVPTVPSSWPHAYRASPWVSLGPSVKGSAHRASGQGSGRGSDILAPKSRGSIPVHLRETCGTCLLGESRRLLRGRCMAVRGGTCRTAGPLLSCSFGMMDASRREELFF